MDTAIDHVQEITASAARFSELIRSSDLTTPVAHLGRWKVRDVAAHLGGVHRWATRIVTTRSMKGPGFTKSKLTGDDLCDWFDAGVEELLATIRSTDGADACPNFNPGSSKTVAWWSRRQMHETTVHRWDVERALGVTTPVGRAVAADGIDEYLDVFVRTRGKQTLTGSLALITDRPVRAWTLTPADQPGRLDVAEGSSAEAEAQLTGPPQAVLLTVWGRLSIAEADLAIGGNPAVAATLTDHQ